MKKYFTLFTIAVLTVFMGVFSSCNNENGLNDSKFDAEIKTVGADYIEVAFTTSAPTEVAYMVSQEVSEDIKAAVIFTLGKTQTVANGDVIKITENIAAESTYHVYVAAKKNASEYTDVFYFKVDTGSYEFTEILTVVETYFDGFKVYVDVPESVVEKNHAMRYAMCDLAVWNKSKRMYGEPDWYNLMFNGGQGAEKNYGIEGAGYFKNDTTIVINGANEAYLDENGKYIRDSNGEPVIYHDAVIPGQPTIFHAGEYAYGNIHDSGTMYAYHPTYENPMNYGYLLPQYDFTKEEWTGTYARKQFYVNMPELLDASDDMIEISDISPIDALITINPDDNVSSYVYWVMPVETYNAVLALIDKEEHMQWFITSYTAFMEGAVMQSGPIQFNTSSMFLEPLTEQSKFYILVTAMGKDAEGKEDATKQKFYKKEFTTAPKTKPAPELVVTALGTEPADPYMVYFNLKAPNKDIAGGTYACNYVREFTMAAKTSEAYKELLYNQFATYGIRFSTKELEQINSDEGYTMGFYSLDGETTRFVAYCCNDEYTFNDIDVKDPNCTAFADYTSEYVPASNYVASSLYEELEGIWTATTELRVKEEDEAGNVHNYIVDQKTRVEVSYGAPEYPETLPDSLYEFYSTMSNPLSREEVDNMFEEFKMLSDDFGLYRVQNHNRLLMTGFVDFDYYQDPGRMDTMSPFDLFCNTTYTSVDVAQLFYDFGPKWYLEVQPDGSVIAPFSATTLPPMSNWGSFPVYLGGYDSGSGMAFYESNENIKGFPVEVSADRNTIKIKPIVISDANGSISYYPNAIIMNQGNPELVAPIISEIVLTRGWNNPVTYSTCSSEPVKANAFNFDGSPVKVPEIKTVKSMTKLVVPERVDYKVVENPNYISLEKFEAGMERAVREKLAIKSNE